MPESGLRPERARAPAIWPRWLLLAAVLLPVGVAYFSLPAFRAGANHVISSIAMGEVRELKELILSFGWWAPVVSALLMILQTLIAPLPAFVLAIANAMAFGIFYGFLLTCSSAILAAFLAFYLTRWLGRPFLLRMGEGKVMSSIDAVIGKYGAWGVLVLRLFPIISFDFVSFAAGLTAMRPRHFGFATFVGMLPATVAFTLLGDSIESASRWSLIGGAILLAALLAGAAVLRRSAAWRSAGAEPATAEAEADGSPRAARETL
ncbi:MAG: TVP38/TMEM64 family protein [bacterium]